MPESATSTVSDQTHLLEGGSQDIHFRPGQPGFVSVHSVPSPHVAHTETGLLAMVSLRRPGSTTPLATAKFKVPSLSMLLSYNATAADLAVPGDWTCTVSNESLDPINFATVVTFPIANPLATASINIEFLNLVLAKVVSAAAIQIHLESSDASSASSLTLSPDIAALLKVPTFNQFPIADQAHTLIDVAGHHIDTVFRIMNLNSDPEYPIIVLSAEPLELTVVMQFDTTSAKLAALDAGVPDIIFEQFSIEINVGFDGSLQLVCGAEAHATILGFNFDESDAVASGVQDGINKHIQGNQAFAWLLDRKQVRAQIDNAFIRLMRLDPRDPQGVIIAQAQINSYHIDGGALIVTYFVLTP